MEKLRLAGLFFWEDLRGRGCAHYALTGPDLSAMGGVSQIAANPWNGVVSDETGRAAETFVRREDAERFLERVHADEPKLAERLRLEAIELDEP
jgi:hypothetical protein